jgi:hypothetical protein
LVSIGTDYGSLTSVWRITKTIFEPTRCTNPAANKKGGIGMVDPKKSAEAVKKIQEIQHTIANHQSNIAKIERDKNDRNKYFDQQIRHEQDEIKRHTKAIDDLKRQI